MSAKARVLSAVACLGLSLFSSAKAVAATVYSYPGYPGAASSPLYTVKANGETIFTEKLTQFAGEMQVHYAHFSLEGTAEIQVTVNESFSSYTLSPKSRKIATTKSGNTLTFSSGPNYLVLKVDSKELLFILIDPPEVNPPKLGDANVKNIMDYNVDNKGSTIATKTIQTAINEASGKEKNILYFPPGKYLTGELFLKSNMTMYLAGGAVLYGSSNTADFNSGSGGMNTEGMQHALVRIMKCKNTKLLGRGVLEANGKLIRSKGLNASVLKMDESSDILVDGVFARNSSYWNTLPYRCDKVTIKNYKVINCRPITTDYNNTDGVDFDECTNSSLYNAFLYTGDDNMAVKSEFLTWNGTPTMNIKNIHHEKIVTYSNSAACKIGTKTMGQSMTNVTFKDVDIVAANRAMVIDAFDNALIENTVFEDIRVENAGILISVQNNKVPSWRSAANQSVIKNTYFTNISSDVKKSIILGGKSSSVPVNGVNFSNFTVQGNPVTSKTDGDASWNINSYVTNITFNTIATAVLPERSNPESQAIRFVNRNANLIVSFPGEADQTTRFQIYSTSGVLESESEKSPDASGQYRISLRSASTGRMLSPGLHLCKWTTKGIEQSFPFAIVR